MNKLDSENVSFARNPRSESEETVVEVPVLLESRLLKILQATAHKQGVSAGTLVRGLLRDFLCYSESSASESDSRKAFLC